MAMGQPADPVSLDHCNAREKRKYGSGIVRFRFRNGETTDMVVISMCFTDCHAGTIPYHFIWYHQFSDQFKTNTKVNVYTVDLNTQSFSAFLFIQTVRTTQRLSHAQTHNTHTKVTARGLILATFFRT